MKRIAAMILIVCLLLSVSAACAKQVDPETVNLPEQTQTEKPTQTADPEEQTWQTGAPEHQAIEVTLPEAQYRKAQSYQEVYQLFTAASDDANDSSYYNPQNTESSVQVLGFDEDNTVKTDGKNIYVLTAQELLIISADLENSQLVGSCSILGGYGSKGASETPLSLCLYNGCAFVLFNYYYWIETKDENGHYTYNSTEQTLIKCFDVSDPANIEPGAVYALDGRYFDAKLIGRNLYLATSFTAWATDPENPGRYIPGLVSGTLKADQDPTKQLIEPENLFLVEPCQSSTFTVVGVLDLEKNLFNHSPIAFTGTATQVLFDEDHVDVALGSYEWLESEPYQENQYKVTDRVQLAVTRLFRLSPVNPADKTDLTVSDACSVSGFLLGRYAMNESKGNLRLVTSEYQYAYKTYVDEAYGFINYVDEGTQTGTTLTVLDNALQLQGSLDLVGEFGTISSVSYQDDLAFVLTSTALDPGFALDLSDPKQPKLIRNVDLPSNCGYWRACGSGQLLGLGVNAASENSSGLTPLLMDVSAPNQIKETARLGGNIQTENGYAIYLDDAILGLPVNGAYCFFDCSNGSFRPLAEIEMNTVYYYNGRVVQTGDALYLCTAASVQVISLEDYQLLCSLAFANG